MMGDVLDDIDGEYEICLKGKTTQNVIPKKSDVENPRRLHRIYLYVYGPCNMEGYSQCCDFHRWNGSDGLKLKLGKGQIFSELMVVANIWDWNFKAGWS